MIAKKLYTERIIEVHGFKVHLITYPYGGFYHPTFNGNMEFKATAKGFRELSSYLRTIKFISRELNPGIE